MPRNSSGTYTLPAGNPVVSGTLIEASWANTTLSDLASAMTNSLSRGGEGGMTAALRLYDGTVSLPGLAFTSETSTGLYRAGSGDMRLAVTGSQVMQFLSTGVAVTGTLSASGNATLSGTLAVTGATTLSSTLAVTGAATFSGQTVTLENSTAYYPQLINRNKTADANGSYIVLEKVRNTSVVQSGDVLGNLIFRGYDGASYLQGAYINAIISATPGTNDMPTDLVFGTTPDGSAGPTERMRIDKAGNLGLGVTPSAWSSSGNLQIKGSGLDGGISSANQYLVIGANGYYNAGWKYTTSSQYATLYQQATGQHQWYTAPSGTAGSAISYTQAMTLDASGNLGVGTTSPAVKLDVAGNATIQNGVLTIGKDTVYDAFINTPESMYFNVDSDGNSTGNKFVWGTDRSSSSGGTEWMRIDSSGNLLVGTSSGSWHNIIKSYSGGYALNVFNTNGGSGDGGMQLRAGTNGTGSYVLNCGYQGPSPADTFRVYGNGTYGTVSDANRKKNIETARDGYLQDLQQLRIVKYNWLTQEDGEAKELGLIAQEVEQVFPGLVETDAENLKMIKQPVLIPMLIKAIQEQQALITSLTARITALEQA